ncbi:hypothetical protein Syun_003837 [Stephania yunnanensis]|uniref:Uncharacterized protein n=1 Tax=Stephania yunnanensis TaxID=152371 RepID=A0AAP0L2W4_9MAGN
MGPKADVQIDARINALKEQMRSIPVLLQRIAAKEGLLGELKYEVQGLKQHIKGICLHQGTPTSTASQIGEGSGQTHLIQPDPPDLGAHLEAWWVERSDPTPVIYRSAPKVCKIKIASAGMVEQQRGALGGAKASIPPDLVAIKVFQVIVDPERVKDSFDFKSVVTSKTREVMLQIEAPCIQLVEPLDPELRMLPTSMTSLAFLLCASMKLIDSLFLLNNDRFAALVPPLWPPARFPVHLAKMRLADGRDTRVDRMLGRIILHTWVLAQYRLQFLLYGTSLLWAFQWFLRYGANIMGVDTLVGCTIRVGSIYALDFVRFAMGAIFALVVLTSSYFYINKVLYEPDWDARVLIPNDQKRTLFVSVVATSLPVVLINVWDITVHIVLLTHDVVTVVLRVINGYATLVALVVVSLVVVPTPHFHQAIRGANQWTTTTTLWFISWSCSSAICLLPFFTATPLS